MKLTDNRQRLTILLRIVKSGKSGRSRQSGLAVVVFGELAVTVDRDVAGFRVVLDVRVFTPVVGLTLLRKVLNLVCCLVVRGTVVVGAAVGKVGSILQVIGEMNVK